MSETQAAAPSDRAGPAVLVTGGGGGIGASVCEAFARAGWLVAVHDLSPSAAEQVVQSILSSGGNAVALVADFAEAASVDGLFEAVDRTVGPIDALINNAAWDPGAVSLSKVTRDLIDRTTAINVTAPLLLTRAAAMRWIAQRRRGCVVNVGSIQSTHSVSGHSVYAACKGAIDAMTYQLAVELGPYDIRVNGVSPGFIEVPRTTVGRPGYDRNRLGARIPLGRVGAPGDVAEVVEFLCSDAARYVSGEMITVDGGSTRQLPTHDHPRPNKEPNHA